MILEAGIYPVSLESGTKSTVEVDLKVGVKSMNLWRELGKMALKHFLFLINMFNCPITGKSHWLNDVNIPDLILLVSKQLRLTPELNAGRAHAIPME